MSLKFKATKAEVWFPILDIPEREFDRIMAKHQKGNSHLVGYPFYRRGHTGRTLWPIPHASLVFKEDEP